MSKKYKNKYRIESTRLQSWNYGWNAAYFVTINTKNRIPYFGEIIDRKMIYSEIGHYAEKYWLEIPQHFPFVKLGSWVVMPNHVHGIIVIDKPKKDQTAINTVDVRRAVETQDFASLPHTTNPKKQNIFGPQSKNLASIIRGYKIGVTKKARKTDVGFQWQASYHDHIIRDDESYKKITIYIRNNPINWKKDRFYK